MHLNKLCRIARTAVRFWREERAISVMEYALGAPLLIALGGYGIEISNLAITNMRVSQYALQIADNASRIGVNSGLSTFQVREGDINDVLQGLRLFGAGTHLTQFGRVTVSSLENVEQDYDSASVQRIHWQRCIGQMNGAGFDSSYGTTTTTSASDNTIGTSGTLAPDGMGDTGQKVTAPAGAAVMFVEVNYQYQPLFGTLFVSPTKLHYVASMIVRDKRDLRQIYNPTPVAVASTCDRHNV